MIIKTDFCFLRNMPVNLPRYLPKFLFTDDAMSASMKALNDEHEKQRKDLIDVAKQFFVSTATWGLEAYEEMLAITPDKSDSYQQRRNRILLRYQSNQTSTVQFLTTLAKRYFAEHTKVKIEEDNANYSFRIIADAVSYDIRGLRDAIAIYKPAHLGWLLVHLIDASGNTNIGGIISQASSLKLCQAIEISFDIAKRDIYFAGIVKSYSLTKLQGGS